MAFKLDLGIMNGVCSLVICGEGRRTEIVVFFTKKHRREEQMSSLSWNVFGSFQDQWLLKMAVKKEAEECQHAQ